MRHKSTPEAVSRRKSGSLPATTLILALGFGALQATAQTESQPDADFPQFNAETLTIESIDPPEKDFFERRLDYHGIPIKASAVVADEAFYEAYRRLHRQLRHNPQVIENLVYAGAELHIIGKDQVTSDLPEHRHLKGKPYGGNPNQTIDTRTRGVGGLLCSCGEENLLQLEDDRYYDRDICNHEFAHTILSYGLSPNVQRQIRQAYEHAQENDLWRRSYAGTNVQEYFAELTMWYFGNHGHYGRDLPDPEPGPEWLRKYDPVGFKIVDRFYRGELDVQPVDGARQDHSDDDDDQPSSKDSNDEAED